MKPKPETAPLDIEQQDDGTWLIRAHAPRDGGGRAKGHTWAYSLSTEDLVKLILNVAGQLLTYAPRAFAKLVASIVLMRAGAK